MRWREKKRAYCHAVQPSWFLADLVDLHLGGIMHDPLQLNIDLKRLLEAFDWDSQWRKAQRQHNDSISVTIPQAKTSRYRN